MICLFVFILFIVIVVLSIEDGRKQEARTRAVQIADVDSMSGLDFEHYVCCLLRHQGYSAEMTKASGDFGADILASRNGNKIAVQTKRYAKKVSNKAVNEAYAAMAHYRCGQCAVVTNNYFTSAAGKLAKSTGCLLVDRDELANWIVDFQGDTVSYIESATNSGNEQELINCHDMTDNKRDELMIDLMAGGVDIPTSFVVAESETPDTESSEVAEPKAQSDADHLAGIFILGGIVTVIYAAFKWFG